MSMIRSTVLVGAAVASAGAMALLGAGAAAADSGINLGPGSNDGVLNGGALCLLYTSDAADEVRRV